MNLGPGGMTQTASSQSLHSQSNLSDAIGTGLPPSSLMQSQISNGEFCTVAWQRHWANAKRASEVACDGCLTSLSGGGGGLNMCKSEPVLSLLYSARGVCVLGCVCVSAQWACKGGASFGNQGHTLVLFKLLSIWTWIPIGCINTGYTYYRTQILALSPLISPQAFGRLLQGTQESAYMVERNKSQ